MKTVSFALIVALIAGVVAKDFNTNLPFEGMDSQSDHAEEEKTTRDGNSGSCGDNLSWIFNDASSTLTISGQGDMSCASPILVHGHIFQIKCRALKSKKEYLPSVNMHSKILPV